MDIFSHLFVVKFEMFVWKDEKNKKEAGDGTYIYNKNVHVDQQCIDQKCPKIHLVSLIKYRCVVSSKGVSVVVRVQIVIKK